VTYLTPDPVVSRLALLEAARAARAAARAETAIRSVAACRARLILRRAEATIANACAGDAAAAAAAAVTASHVATAAAGSATAAADLDDSAAAANARPWPSTIRRTPARPAPRARRMPISRVRRPTA